MNTNDMTMNMTRVLRGFVKKILFHPCKDFHMRLAKNYFLDSSYFLHIFNNLNYKNLNTNVIVYFSGSSTYSADQIYRISHPKNKNWLLLCKNNQYVKWN